MRVGGTGDFQPTWAPGDPDSVLGHLMGDRREDVGETGRLSL